MAETAEALWMALLALIDQLALVQIPWLFSWGDGYLFGFQMTDLLEIWNLYR